MESIKAANSVENHIDAGNQRSQTLEKDAKNILKALKSQNFELTMELLTSKMLNQLKTPESFFTIVWTIVSHLYHNSKIAKLKRIVDLFEETKQQESMDFYYEKVGPQIEEIICGKKRGEDKHFENAGANTSHSGKSSSTTRNASHNQQKSIMDGDFLSKFKKDLKLRLRRCEQKASKQLMNNSTNVSPMREGRQSKIGSREGSQQTTTFQITTQKGTATLSNHDDQGSVNGIKNSDKTIGILQNLNTYLGLLEALFKFGNTLELLYIGGMLHQPTTVKERSQHTLIPLYVEFKSKKCHQCSKPIIDYKQGLFCSNIFLGLTDLDQACYKFVCRDCLGEQWDTCKNNLLYKCACCKGQCPPTSVCSTMERVRDNPQSLVDREIYWYHWRGKRCYVRARIAQYDKIRKQHKIVQCESDNSHKLCLDKESFFEVGIIPKNSKFWKYIERPNGGKRESINLKEVLQQVTDLNLKKRGQELNENVQARYKQVKEEQAASALEIQKSQSEQVEPKKSLTMVTRRELNRKEFSNIQLLAAPIPCSNIKLNRDNTEEREENSQVSNKHPQPVSEQKKQKQPLVGLAQGRPQRIRRPAIVMSPEPRHQSQHSPKLSAKDQPSPLNLLVEEPKKRGRKPSDINTLKKLDEKLQSKESNNSIVEQLKNQKQSSILVEEEKVPSRFSSRKQSDQIMKEPAQIQQDLYDINKITIEEQEFLNIPSDTKIIDKFDKKSNNFAKPDSKKSKQSSDDNEVTTKGKNNGSSKLKTKRGVNDKLKGVFQPIGPAHKNGVPLVPLPCTHIVQEVNEQIQDQMESYRVVARDFPENLVGQHIFIYWGDDDVWYRAKVLKYLNVTKKFKIIYDDKNDEKIDLTQESFLMEDERLKTLATQRKREVKAATANFGLYTAAPPLTQQHASNNQKSDRLTVKVNVNEVIQSSKTSKKKTLDLKQHGSSNLSQTTKNDFIREDRNGYKILGKRQIKRPQRYEPEDIIVKPQPSTCHSLSATTKALENFVNQPPTSTIRIKLSDHGLKEVVVQREAVDNKIKIQGKILDLSKPKGQISPVENTLNEKKYDTKIEIPMISGGGAVVVGGMTNSITQVKINNFDQPMKNTKEVVKQQLLAMNEKVIDGFKIFHMDLPKPSDDNKLHRNESKTMTPNNHNNNHTVTEQQHQPHHHVVGHHPVPMEYVSPTQGNQQAPPMYMTRPMIPVVQGPHPQMVMGMPPYAAQMPYYAAPNPYMPAAAQMTYEEMQYQQSQMMAHQYWSMQPQHPQQYPQYQWMIPATQDPMSAAAAIEAIMSKQQQNNNAGQEISAGSSENIINKDKIDNHQEEESNNQVEEAQAQSGSETQKSQGSSPNGKQQQENVESPQVYVVPQGAFMYPPQIFTRMVQPYPAPMPVYHQHYVPATGHPQFVQQQQISSQQQFLSNQNLAAQGQGQQTIVSSTVQNAKQDQNLTKELPQHSQIKGVMTAQLNHQRQTIQVLNGSPRELLKTMESGDVGRVRINPKEFLHFQDYDINGLVSDSLKHFYNYHETQGYKNCLCSSCIQLAYPILIRANRSPSDYEELHKSYLALVQYQKPNQQANSVGGVMGPQDKEGSQNSAGQNNQNDSQENKREMDDNQDYEGKQQEEIKQPKIQNIKLIFF